MTSTLRLSDLPDELIGMVSYLCDISTALNTTCSQLRQLFGSVKLNREASERFISEPEFRDRIQTRMVSHVRNITTCVRLFSPTHLSLTS